MAPHTAWALQTVILCDMRGDKSLGKAGKPPWAGDCSLSTGFFENMQRLKQVQGQCGNLLGC